MIRESVLATVMASAIVGCGGGGSETATVSAAPATDLSSSSPALAPGQAPAPGPTTPPSAGSPQAPSPAPAIAFAYSTSLSVARVGKSTTFAPASLSSSRPIVSCHVKAGSANAATFASAGLSADPSSCVITAASPTAAMPTTRFTLQAVDASGETAEATIDIRTDARRNSYSYMVRDGADAIDVYSPDPVTGELGFDSRLSLAAGASPVHSAYDPVHHRLYIAEQGSGRISVAEVDPLTGALSSPNLASTLIQPTKLAVDSTGRHLFALYGVANAAVTGVASFRIQADGSLVMASYQPTPRSPVGEAIDPTGRYLFASTYFGTLHPFSVDPSSGVVSPGIQTGAPYGDLVFDAAGTHLYAADGFYGRVHVFTLGAGGALGLIQTYDTTAFKATAIALDPAGAYLWAVDGFSHVLQVMTIDAGNGKVANASSVAFSAACTATSVAAAVDGKAVHIGCANGGPVHGFAVNRSNGLLAPWATSPMNVGARAIVSVAVP